MVSSSQAELRFLDYPSMLGGFKPPTPEEKEELDRVYKELRNIAKQYDVTIITAHHVERK